ncbi:hypothetical protein [Telmatospirillum siberiense]|uniref:Uncharacterized protein n=1 Tax=Telmatospirillum siberiense TaxID=382514 RepID=A0A2N3PS01_9PROT|nr:hypothetical protein [Telmatospirillum siberiense]PKU23165.1 hypothetical protein CWS72_18245 [Telmatospirillum siberiense]
MSVKTFNQPDSASMICDAYPSAIDASVSVLSRLGAAFAPHARATPDMTVALDAGHVFDGATLTEVAAQNASLTAPAANPRIDRIVINQLTGTVSVVTGTEAASPAVPAIPSGFAPVARVRLSAGATVITNDMITDERDLSALGRIIAVEAGTGLTGGGSSGTVTIGLETPVAVALGGTGTATAAANTVFAGPASGSDAAPSFRSLTLADLPADVATTEDVAKVALQHGQCRLVLSGSNLLLSPYNGKRLIVGGVMRTVPAAGVSLSPIGLTAGTVYYIYAYMTSGGEMALEASTTSHGTDSSTGVEIKAGDASRTLVGMACPQTGPVFVQSPNAVGVLSWFNRRRLRLVTVYGQEGEAGSALTELSSAARVYALNWSDEPPMVGYYVYASVENTSGQSCSVALALDSTSVAYQGVNTGVFASGSSSPTIPFAVPPVVAVDAAEGVYHYFTVVGLCQGATASFFNISVVGDLRG